MFRIHALGDRGSTLQVEGRIVGDGSTVLERECRSRLGTGSSVRLDLERVRYIDREAVALLRRLRREGLELTNCSPLLEEMLDEGEGAR